MSFAPRSLFLATVAAMSLFSQTGGTGAITGVLTDPAGAIIPQGDVKAVNVETGDARSTVTSAAGSYLISLLPPGVYRV